MNWMNLEVAFITQFDSEIYLTADEWHFGIANEDYR
jgi:hypothetical protein